MKIKNKIFKNLFSLKNEYCNNKTFKVITFLGIKLKCRNLPKEMLILEKRIHDLEKNNLNQNNYIQSNLQEQINKFYFDNCKPSEMPKFSLIMPAYNRLFCIKNAIESVLNQTYKNFELIIVDDESTDSTEDFIKSNYINELKSGKIKYIKQKHGGVSSARNTGLKNCSNDWIGYIDTDNVLTKNFLETFAFHILKYNETKIFYGKMIRIYENKVIGHSFDYDELIIKNYIDMGIFVHNKSIYNKLGGFNEKLTRLVDWDLIIRYTKDNTPFFINEILCLYNDSEEYKRISNSENLEENYNKLLNKLELTSS